ncbi:hypothetical protein B1690_02590 [Geobacillus sp. 46C-IIa]|uniref:hypothetical protein n=1 Tax=Geobacillus sp. 46C-IIa TaxID=1963025 RepID=UPI0009C15818|nr:hypothetical protein [Geobacillus sp. 46C-IIa]OQP07436.1 hypothetical protein B1690_02590 [Geobacillus sp. 46C-IIa]QNU28393.1 hypothetical protein IC803_02110 [Geobacillus sp. 46C-IIa]
MAKVPFCPVSQAANAIKKYNEIVTKEQQFFVRPLVSMFVDAVPQNRYDGKQEGEHAHDLTDH